MLAQLKRHLANHIAALGQVPSRHTRQALYHEWYHTHAQKLLQWRDRHQGQTCVIVGNGPSLNQTDLTQLKAVPTFGLNKIYLLFDRTTWRPTYHVAVNPLVVAQAAATLSGLPCPTFLSYRAARDHVPPTDHVNYILTRSRPPAFVDDLREPLYEGHTVTYVALQIAYYMGFNTVILIGVDHRFQATGQPNEKQLLAGNDPNHFDPHYFANQHWQLPDLDGSEVAYHMARYQYQRTGRRIIDSTVDGALTIFPKLPLNQALAQSRRQSAPVARS